MKPAHVLVVSRIVPHHGFGGMQMVAWDVARELTATGTRVTVLTTRLPGRPATFEESGVRIVALPEALPGIYSNAWWRGSREFFARELAESVTGVLSVSAGAFALLALRSKWPGVKFVMQAHGTSLDEFLSKWRTRRPWAMLTSARNAVGLLRDLRMYRQFDTVVAVGPAVADGLRRAPLRWALPAARIKLIPNGVDTRRFCPNAAARQRVRVEFGWAGDDCVVVVACRLHAQKGVAEALRGFAEFAKREPRARFVIAGDGPERAALENLTRKLDVAGRVTFAGEIERGQLAELLQASDVFLFPTLRIEGLPLNVLEALAVGLPALVSDHLTGVLALGEGVRAVKPRDPLSIAVALQNASAGSRGRLPEEYTLARCAARYAELLGGER